MTRRVDLIADVGESFGSFTMHNDQELLPLLTSANVACGFHAGDPRVMQTTVAACARLEVAVGAHPGFPDLVGFGRRDMKLTENEVFTDVLYQIGALHGFLRAANLPMQHVAPHGRLGNLVQVDAAYAKAVVDAVEAFDPNMIVVGLGGEIIEQASARGLRTAQLGVVDRNYEDDGRLVARSRPDALLHDAEEIAARTLRLVRDGVITSVNGVDVPVRVDSVLLHGDNPEAIASAAAIRSRLVAAGVEVVPMTEVVQRPQSQG